MRPYASSFKLVMLKITKTSFGYLYKYYILKNINLKLFRLGSEHSDGAKDIAPFFYSDVRIHRCVVSRDNSNLTGKSARGETTF